MTFKHHDLKIWPEFYAELIAGRKPFELRKNDRNFEVGDELDLYEYDPKTEQFTGCVAVRTVTYILGHRPDAGCAATFGIQPGYVILGVSAPAQEPMKPVSKQWIVDLIRDQFDPAPSHYRLGDNWDDGAETIADSILANLPLLRAEGSAIPSTERCAKCGCETKREEALVNGEIWCHPCADGAT